MDTIGQFTGSVAHDFNNILAVAIGNLDLLEVDIPLGSEGQEMLESARSACLRGAELTARLLAFARKQTLSPVDTDVNLLLNDYTKLLARLLGEEIVLHLDPSKELWRALVDKGQLEAAIANLATNARDAMPGGGRLTISTRNEILERSYTRNHRDLDPGEYVAIEVNDTGQGMTAEIRDKAIEPFFTTKPEGKGTGLGLSMVFGFAKQSNGHVRIYSEIDHGTTITVFLPRARAELAHREAGDVATPFAGLGETVLVVEDNASLRRVAVKQLMALGYKTLEAADGPSALEVLNEEPDIALLLTDVVMPGGMTGVHLGREAQRVRPGLRVIYMSGFAETAFGEQARLEADITLICKPFGKAELAMQIRQALDGWKSQ